MRVVRSILLFVLLIAVALAVPLLFIGHDGGRVAPPTEGAPWQIEVASDATTRVFHLTPGTSTFDEARLRFGADADLALLIAPGETGSVEAYYESVSAGPVTGRLVLTLATTLAERETMLARASKAKPMGSATRRVALAEADVRALGQARIAALTFIPTADLDEETVLRRFGVPAERVRIDARLEHFLYPALGLDVRLDTQGKEVLQYVAPRDFARLREPLLAQTAH